jgi:putative sigma-54 modulation protein
MFVGKMLCRFWLNQSAIASGGIWDQGHLAYLCEFGQRKYSQSESDVAYCYVLEIALWLPGLQKLPIATPGRCTRCNAMRDALEEFLRVEFTHASRFRCRRNQLAVNGEEFMRITVHNYHADLAEALRLYIERRLKFALDRFGGRVDEVAVRISGDGPEANNCRISTEVSPLGRIAVEENDADLFAAIDRATGRIGRVFGNELKRARNARVGRESVRLLA